MERVTRPYPKTPLCLRSSVLCRAPFPASCVPSVRQGEASVMPQFARQQITVMPRPHRVPNAGGCCRPYAC